jgi:serine phosphatase RsbU (regulator of sigma subunit)
MFHANANNQLLLFGKQENEKSASSFLSILEEGKDTMSFHEMIKSDSLFKPNNKNEVINLGFTDKNYWIKLEVKNEDPNENLILEFAYPFYNKLDVYISDTSGHFTKETVGDHFKFGDRKIKHKNFLFELHFKNQEIKTIYAHLKCDGEATSLPINIVKPIKLIQKNYEEQTFLGLYYGIIIFALFLSIFLSFSLQESINYQYFFYIIGVGLFQFSLDGLSFEYLWPNNVWLANHIIPISGSFAIFFLIKFTQYLLNTKKHTPNLSAFLNVLATADVLLFLCAFFDNPFYSTSLLVLNIIAIVSNITIYLVAIKVYRIGFRPAKYFLLAFQLLIIGTLTAMLKNFGILPRIFITEYGIQIGSAIEIIFFSFALSERVRALKDEKQEIQNQLFEQLQENNKLQIEQNIKLEKKVIERTFEIQKQSQIILEKNKDITDSINYAKRIQDAMLSKAEAQFLNDDNFFIFYKPRDIVSGDFYWYTQVNHTIIIAAVDCTGHGVPGALMSMIGSTLLNSIVNDMKITQPSSILKMLDQSIQIALKQKVDMISNKDGMDIAICKVDLLQKKLHFSGAQRPLYFCNQNGIEVYRGNPNSVGGYFEDQVKQFHDLVIDFKDGDVFYISSDGYADQFGGPNSKKYMTKNFKVLLNQSSKFKMQAQKTKIETEFSEWKGSNQQVDDILVIGMKL